MYKLTLKRILFSSIASTVLIGYLSGFRFGAVNVWLYDQVYTFQSHELITTLTWLFYMLATGNDLADLITQQRIGALFISIINPLIALFSVIVFYNGLNNFMTFTDMFPERRHIDGIIFLVLHGATMMFQVVIQVRALKTLKLVLNAPPGL